jgi:hypothetical protein
VVETIRLESGHTLTGIVGSNPTLSAILFSYGLTREVLRSAQDFGSRLPLRSRLLIASSSNPTLTAIFFPQSVAAVLQPKDSRHD